MISDININGKSIINKDYFNNFSKEYIDYISKTSQIYIRTYTHLYLNLPFSIRPQPSTIYRDVPLIKNQNP